MDPPASNDVTPTPLKQLVINEILYGLDNFDYQNEAEHLLYRQQHDPNHESFLGLVKDLRVCREKHVKLIREAELWQAQLKITNAQRKRKEETEALIQNPRKYKPDRRNTVSDPFNLVSWQKVGSIFSRARSGTDL